MATGEFISNCTADALTTAAQLLKAGGLVALPTETVYGLGADATNKDAVARIYEVKGRPADHPLIVHIHSMQSLGDWADEIPSYAISLARNFWPGPMTLIFFFFSSFFLLLLSLLYVASALLFQSINWPISIKSVE